VILRASGLKTLRLLDTGGDYQIIEAGPAG
jgi:hypothetical protein